MDYREHLFRPLSLHFVDQLVQDILDTPSDLGIVYQLIFDPEIKIAWRAAWVCQKISIRHPEWFTGNQFMKIASFTLTTTHGGLHRGCLSILYNLAVPGSIPVEFINACFEWMISPKSPIAVQVYSMKMLLNICTVEPGFTPELIAYLGNVDPGDYSAGFNSTRKHVLKALTNK